MQSSLGQSPSCTMEVLRSLELGIISVNLLMAHYYLNESVNVWLCYYLYILILMYYYNIAFEINSLLIQVWVQEKIFGMCSVTYLVLCNRSIECI